MSHTIELPSGWRIHHNSDWSGDVIFAAPDGRTAELTVAIIAELIEERGLRIVPVKATDAMRKAVRVDGQPEEDMGWIWRWTLDAAPPLAELLERTDAE